jgi:polyferredoxin
MSGALVQIGNPGAALGGLRPGGVLRPLRTGERVALAVAALGAAVLALALLAPGRPAAWLGAWGALLGSLGLFAAGGGAYYWFAYRDTSPGVRNDGILQRGISARGASAWILGVLLSGFYVLLYWHPAPLEGAIRLLDPLSWPLRGAASDQWFLYGTLYTLAVLVFGVRMLMRWRHSRYQLVRTASVAFFQLGFAFLLPAFLRRVGQPEFYFSYFWPLQYDALFPGTVRGLLSHEGGLGAFWVGWGLLAISVLTPVLTYFFGKRWYCSWVCGCGGLAETAGDPFRQLSDKSEKAWRFERWSIHSVLVLITVVTAALWLAESFPGTRFAAAAESGRRWYGFFVGAAFSGVVGVGFYPVMGSRVWCRFGCPMAAILGLQQRFLSRFRITTNGGQCISCGNCSTYCEMGIDVRAYAQRGENIVRASCVGCGVCAAVCPRGVLRLESGPVGNRFPGAAQPLRALLDALRGRPASAD